MGDTQVRVQITGEASGLIGALGQVQAKVGEIARATQTSTTAVTASFEGQAQAVAKVDHGLRDLIAVVASLGGLGSLVASFKDSALQAERLQNSLRFATGNAITAADAHSWLKTVVQELGLEMGAASRGFMTLAAAARGTSLEGQGVQTIFRAVASATTALGLSADQAEGSFLAISQMISKGKVSAEELRGQLGERLPGAFNLAAQAMGVTTGELDVMLKKGEVVASDFLPKFAAELQKAFGADAAAAASGTQASLNRLGTAWTELQQTVAKSGLTQAAGGAVDALTKSLRAAVTDGSAATLGQTLGTVVRGLSGLTQGLWEHRDAMLVVVGLWTAWKMGPAVAAGISAVKDLTATIIKMGSTKTVVDALSGATSTMTTGFSLATAASGGLKLAITALGGPVGAIVALVGAVVVGLTVWAMASKDTTGQVLKDAGERINALKEEIRLYKERQRQAGGQNFQEKASDGVLTDLKKLEQEYGARQVRIKKIQDEIARFGELGAGGGTGGDTPAIDRLREEQTAAAKVLSTYRELTGLEIERQGIAEEERKKQAAMVAAIKAAEDAAKKAGGGVSGEDKAYKAMEQLVAREAQLRKQRQSDWEKHQGDVFELYGTELDREERKLNTHYDEMLRRVREFNGTQAQLDDVEAQREAALQEARTESVRKATEERMRLAREEAEERMRYLEQYGTAQQGWQAGLEAFTQRAGTAFTSMRDMAMNAMGGIQNSFARGIAGLITGQMRLGQALKAVWQGIIGTIAQFVAQYIARMIALAIAKRLLGEQEKEVESSKAVASQHAAAAGIFAAHSGIPFVGPVIAAGFIAMMNVVLGTNIASAKGMSATARATGGLAGLHGPELTLLGENGIPEVVAPEKDFKAWAGSYAALGANLASSELREREYQTQASRYAAQGSEAAGQGAGSPMIAHVDLRGATIMDTSDRGLERLGNMVIAATQVAARRRGQVVEPGQVFGGV